MRTVLAVLLAIATILGSGCLSSGDTLSGPDSSAPSGSDSTPGPSGGPSDDPSESPLPTDEPPAQNAAPVLVVSASTLNGTAPLNVTFTIDASDADGDELSWSLDADGDGDEDAGGDTVPASAAFLYEEAGVYNATVSVSDGAASDSELLSITVAQLVLPADKVYNGTLNGVPWIFVIGDTVNGDVPGSSATHNFTLDVPVNRMIVTLVQEEDPTGDPLEYGFVDLDMTIIAPDGTQTRAAAAGPEPPVVFEAPAMGAWSIDLFAFSAYAQADYSLTIHFE